MSYRVEKLSSDPVMILTLNADFNMRLEGEAVVYDILKVLDAQREPIFYIGDMLRVTLSLDDFIAGTHLATQGKMSLLKHSNMREVIVVTTSKAYKFAFKGFNTVTFGNIPVRLFDTMQEALDYCRMA